MFRFKNIRYFYTKVQRKIKNFLLSDKSREFLVFLFFFVVSTGFWLLQTLKNDYETEFTIPLRLKGVPNDAVLTSELPSELKIQIKDKGTVLLNYMLGQSFYPLTLDFDTYKNRGNHVRIYARELEKKILSQLNASTRLLAIKPDTLEFIYSRGKAKKVPVLLQGNISTSPQYYLTDTIYSQDSVIVYAPKSILDTLQYARTEPLNLNNLTDTTRQTLSLAKIKGVKFVPNSVNILLPIDLITEKTLEIPLIGVDFPADKILRTFPSKVKVTFQVGLNYFKDIHPDDFILEVPYNELLNNNSEKYKVKIKSMPAGVSHIRISPAEIDYLIEQLPTYNNDED